MAKKINKALDTLRDVVKLVDQLGTSVGGLEERMRGLVGQFQAVSQLTGNNKNPAIAAPPPSPGMMSTLALGPNNVATPPALFAPPGMGQPPLILSPYGSPTNPNAAATPAQQAAMAAAQGQGQSSGNFAGLATTLSNTNTALIQVAQALNSFVQQQQSGQTPGQVPGTPGATQPGAPAPVASNDIKDLLRGVKDYIGAAVAVGTAGYAMYSDTNLAMRRTNLGAVRRGEEAEGHAVGAMQSRYLEQMDLSRPENMLKYRGDVLFPGRTKYLGESGWQRALRDAARESTDQLEFQRYQATDQATRGVGSVIGGVGTVIGGAAMGFGGNPAMGGAIGMQGLAGITGGVNQTVQAYNSPYDVITNGGLASTAGGRLILGSNRANQWADENMTAARAEQTAQLVANAEALQRADMDQHKIELAGMELSQQGIETRKRGAILIGKYARGGYDDVSDAAKAVYQRLSADEKSTMDTASGISEASLSATADARGFTAGPRQKTPAQLRAQAERNFKIWTDAAKDEGITDTNYKTGEAYIPGNILTTSEAELKDMEKSGGYAWRAQIIRSAKKAKDQMSSYADQDEKEKAAFYGNAPSDGPRAPSGAHDWKWYSNMIANFESKGATDIYGGDNEYFVANQGQPGGGKSSAFGRYQVIGGIHAKRFKEVTGEDWSTGRMKPELQDQYFREELLPSYKAGAKGVMGSGLGRYLHEEEAIALQQLGAGSIQNLLTGNGTKFDIEKVLPQMAGIVRRTDKFAGLQPNTAFLDKLAENYGIGQATASLSGKASRILSEMPDSINRAGQDYGMTAPEFTGYRNRLLNYISPSANEGENVQKTAGLLGLQFGGMGSFESLMGNLSGLNQNKGGLDNTANLVNIMSNAVAIGFDRSRNAQQFVQAVTDLTGKFGTTNSDYVSDALASSSRFLSNTVDLSGRSDERGLAMAKRGMEQLEQETSKTDGLLGAVKAAALIRNGQNLGSGIASLMGMGASETRASIQTLRGLEASNGGDGPSSLLDIHDPKLRMLVGGQAGGNVSEQVRNLEKAIGEGQRATTAVEDARVRYAGGMDVQGQLNGLKNRAKTAAPRTQLEDTVKFADSYARSLMNFGGHSFESAQSMAIKRLKDEGVLDSVGGEEQLKKNMLAGRQIAIDPADVSGAKGKDALGQYVNAMYAAPITTTEMKQVLANYGGGIRVKGDKGEYQITSKRYDQYLLGQVHGDEAKAIQKLEKSNRRELGAKTGMEDILSRPDQAAVKISNTGDIGKAIVDALLLNGVINKSAGHGNLKEAKTAGQPETVNPKGH